MMGRDLYREMDKSIIANYNEKIVEKFLSFGLLYIQ